MTSDRSAASGTLLDVLCPMHLVLDADGRIVHAGPTAQRSWPCGPVGRAFLELFDVKRPRLAPGVAGLRAAVGRRLHCVLRGAPGIELKGVAAPLPGDRGSGRRAD